MISSFAIVLSPGATKDWCQKACQSLTKTLAVYKTGRAVFFAKDNSEANVSMAVPNDPGPEYREIDKSSRLEGKKKC